MLNLPNSITIARILLVPAFLFVFWSPGPHNIIFGMLILAIAGITDVIDGYLARKYKMITPLGKILDPLADKLMVITVMISLFLIGKFPLWLVFLVLVKELVLVVGSSFIVFKKKFEISANVFGKAATIAIYLALFWWAFGITGSSIISLLAGIIALLSLVNYIRIFMKIRLS